MNKSFKTRVRRMLATLLIAALCICNMAVPAFADEAVAAAFHLSQTEGTVTVQNQNGKEITTMQDMKLFNGYQIDTAQQSYAWFEADSSKLFKMDAVSNLEVRKKGKQLELLLNSGNLFFNVTEHLQDDEVLNIRTSSMVVGIRGTSGWVQVIDQFHTILYMLDGSVEASVTDPVSGQRKSITLHGGQRADFWIYDKNKQGDKCDIFVQQYGEEEIDGFVAVELKKNQALQDRVRAAISGYISGFDLDRVIAQAEERLLKDQTEIAAKIAEIEKEIAKLASRVDVDPVFTNNTTKEDSRSESSSTTTDTSTSTDTTPDETIDDPTTLTMPVEDDVVNDYLNNKNVSVILQPSSNASDNVLTVDSGLTVPSGKSLTIGTGISTNVQSGQTMQVDGHMEQEGDLANAGTVNNTSTNTLQVGGNLTNTGTLNNETGRLIVKGTLVNSGSLTSGNIIENTNTMENTGTFTVTGGTVGAVSLSGGTLTVKGGTITSVAEQGGKLSMDGGTVETVITTQDSMDLNNGEVNTVTIDGGSFKAAGGDAKNIILKSGTFTVENGGTTGDITVEGGQLTVSGGTTGAIGLSGGTFTMSGGTTKDITLSGGAFTTSGGTTGAITMSDGTFTADGGTTGAITVDGGTFTVNSGSTGTVTMSGGTMTTNGGTVQGVKLTGGTFNLTEGTTDQLTLTDGTVTVLTNATLGHAEINGGEFVLDGGTVTDGITQNADAVVTLTSGSIEAGDADAALVIEAGQIDLNMDDVVVTADTAASLLTVDGKGEVQIHSSLFEAEPSPFGTGAVVLCKPESVLTYETEGEFQKMQGPYTLTGIWGNLDDALNYMGEENAVLVLSEDTTLSGNNIKGYFLANATYVIELNGNDLNLVDWLTFSIGNDGDGEATPTRFAFHDESGKGTLKVDTGLEIHQYAAVLFENLNLEFGDSGYLMPGYRGCVAISLDQVKITDAGGQDGNVPIIQSKEGSAGVVRAKAVTYEGMTRPFCTETETLFLEDSTFQGEDVPFFRNSSIAAPKITYSGNVLLSMNGPFPYDGVLAEDILPTEDQCSSSEGQGIVIRMKNYAPGFDTFLEEAGYTLLSKDDGYQYIMPLTTTSLALIEEPATPSDLIPVVDEDLATPSDAESADEILDMDYIIWDEDLATASNASRSEDEILDEDFFWLDEDWEEDEDEAAASQTAVTEEVLIPEDSITLENRLTEEANEAADTENTADTGNAEHTKAAEDTKPEKQEEENDVSETLSEKKPDTETVDTDASKKQSADAAPGEEEES